MKHFDDLVVGAGLFGCVYAHEMRRQGRNVLVIDKRDHVAGNIFTKEIRGIQVHEYGAHIFHTSDREVWDYANRFCMMNHYINAPVAVYRDELYNLPFNMNTFSRMWQIRTPAEAKKKIAQQTEAEIRRILSGRLHRQPEEITEEEVREFQAKNLEEQGLSLAGRDIFDKLIRGYTEKQWGRKCEELPAFIIKRLPFRFVYDNNYFNDPYQGIPVGGYTAFCEKLLGLRPCGSSQEDDLAGSIEVRCKTDYRDLVVMQEDGLPARPFALKSGERFDRLIYTGAVDAFFSYKEGTLEYRSLRFEKEDLPEEENYQGNAVVNYTEREVPFTRIIEHKHFEFGKGEGTVITREYPASWKRGDEPYYPMNDEKNNALFARYMERAKQMPDVIFGGRLGAYRYFNMDQVIRTALDAAKNNFFEKNP